MSVEDTATDVPTAAREPHVSPADDTWAEEPLEELPPRPRRRLFAPLPLALLGVLLLACGFIGGVLVEKGQSTSTSSAGAASGLASRFAALRAGSSGGGASGAAGAASAFAGGAGGGGATAGSVAYLDGSTLYVTTAEGNTVKVTTSPATTVTKTVKAEVKGIHPGETVTVTGATGSNGAVSAESIRVGAGGGLGALFSGSGAGGGAGGEYGSRKAFISSSVCSLPSIRLKNSSRSSSSYRSSPGVMRISCIRAAGTFCLASGQTVKKFLNLFWMAALLPVYASQRIASG